MLFLSPISRSAAWALLGGYAISGLLECLSLNKVRYTLRGYTDDEKDTLHKLSKVHAYRIYQNIALIMTAAMQITLVIVYTYLAISAETMIVSLGLGMLCRKTSLLSREGVNTLKSVAVNITLPAVMFSAFATAEYSLSSISIPVSLFAACLLALFLGLVIVSLVKTFLL